jgi:hypothetical protein
VPHRTLKVLVIEPGKPAEVREIEDSLNSLKAVVGGWIENVFLRAASTYILGRPDGTFVTLRTPDKAGLVFIVDEEGGPSIKDLPLNRWFTFAGACGRTNLHGTIIVARYTRTGDNANLSNADVAAFRDW